MFSEVCVFIYHTSGYMSMNHQVAINATENLKSKLTFERESHIQGVVIKGYHTGNGIFNSSEFMEELLKNQQNIMFSGAGASYQNGAVEHSINTVVTMSRTMLMHTALICPEETLSTDIWPMEMDYSVWVYNRIPDM